MVAQLSERPHKLPVVAVRQLPSLFNRRAFVHAWQAPHIVGFIFVL